MKQSNKKRVLLVDDSEVVAGVVLASLEEVGYEVFHAANGLEGVEKAYELIPDLIIMDVEMPLMNGFQATRFLKTRKGICEIPILMHTTLSDERDRSWGIECGASALLVKDFDQISKLIKGVELWIDHPPYTFLAPGSDPIEKLKREQIIELSGHFADRALFNLSTINKLIDANNYMDSLKQTVEQIFKMMTNICDFNIGALALKNGKVTLVFSQIKDNIYRNDQKDFTSVSLNDFYERFPDLSQEPMNEVLIGIEDKKDFDKLRLDKEKIRAYYLQELKNKKGEIFGTIHLGNFVNNYFTEKFVAGLVEVGPAIGSLVENALSYHNLLDKEQKIRGVFSKFVPAEVIESLIQKQDVASLLVGEKRSLSILFADIRSFTTISENNTAEAVVGCLNSYFDLMAQAIKRHGGIIDKFIGDAILAVFGAPVSYEDNPQRAVRAAIDMLEALKLLDTSKLSLPKSGFQIGIGIHDGVAIVGNIGSKEKFDYTVIGDAVNLASRLEGLTKHYGQKIIVSEDVKKRVEDSLFVRELDNVKVKGKNQATTMFGIPWDNRDAFTPEVIKDYQKALSMYKIQNWLTAIDYFKKILEQIPEDHIAKMYIKRCEDFQKKPPGTDWDGAIELDFK
jgi:class 3 adenylate cyclase/CheY-like chemotaxis protein